MLKVFIVDDEPWIVSLIENLIPWKSHGFLLTGSASDGEEALRSIRFLKPDVILTDIRMPEMNGIELIQLASKLDHAPEFIILSGHSEFSYAQKALQQGVHDYLLKPVDEEELLSVLKGVKEKIQIRNRTEKKIREDRVRMEKLSKMVLSDDSDESSGDVEEERDRIKKAISIMERDYSRDLSLSDISSQVYLSESYFSDIFSKETGRTFKDYLTDIRMEKARELLAKPGLKIKDVAGLTGYSNPNYFCKVFRKKTGMSPKEFIATL
ncbi:MAG: response regulator [Spirochaetales bacterium]|nr:response regulator [Spirochaetales bacterium]